MFEQIKSKELRIFCDISNEIRNFDLCHSVFVLNFLFEQVTDFLQSFSNGTGIRNFLSITTLWFSMFWWHKFGKYARSYIIIIKKKINFWALFLLRWFHSGLSNRMYILSQSSSFHLCTNSTAEEIDWIREWKINVLPVT